MTDSTELHVSANLESASASAAEALAAAFARSPGWFGLALSGGATPRLLYELLGSVFADRLDWTRIHVFWVDERWVAPDAPESNVRLVRETFLDRVAIPSDNVHPPPVDAESLEVGAEIYEAEIRSFVASGGHLRWVLLGLGGDGHIASLFPGRFDPEDTRWVLPVGDSPKPPSERLSMSLSLINSFDEAHFLVAGASKAVAVRAALNGDAGPAEQPARGVRASRVAWWLDNRAARELEATR